MNGRGMKKYGTKEKNTSTRANTHMVPFPDK
jgi:hypothetical protein